tara:strand:- start:1477 stop:2076 length:600 start_codon:yes stop_codon:yes gene_type:complete
MALTKVKTSAVAGIPASVYNAHVPSGSILQTVTTTDSTSTSYASTDSANPKTVISLAITPSSTSSKILMFGFISIGSLYSSYSGRLDYIGVRLKRGSTVIGETTDLSSATTVHGGDATGARPMHSTVKDAGYSASRPASVPFHFVDSPSTTSATTYNVQGVIEKQGSQYTMLRNIGGYNYNNDEMASATCQLTLMEIKG